jgi:hypothetical protein
VQNPVSALGFALAEFWQKKQSRGANTSHASNAESHSGNWTNGRARSAPKPVAVSHDAENL